MVSQAKKYEVMIILAVVISQNRVCCEIISHLCVPLSPLFQVETPDHTWPLFSDSKTSLLAPVAHELLQV